MNTPLQFPTIDDKTIYQMSLNPGTSAGTYVTEPNAVLTNQILEILNPTSNEIDKARMFTDLMAPHYQKQDEIIEKIDKLANIVTSFIETQKSINEFILDRLLKSKKVYK
ncbi:unnamed protein product [Caenorhabditis angaria]|uniref:Uncharacterized protein n=1 Tax=Caenorhabditis angaria TaxID=860376 RepID=A0A9P1I576_9PELO|nr:unnamed protein product [Caenorhabditis angaria]